MKKNLVTIGIVSTTLVLAAGLVLLKSERSQQLAPSTEISAKSLELPAERTKIVRKQGRSRLAKQPIPSLFDEIASEPTELEASAKSDPPSKIVHGVSADLWAKQQANTLRPTRPSGEYGAGVRVYVQCMELKKDGPSYLDKSTCEGLLANERSGAEYMLSRGRAY